MDIMYILLIIAGIIGLVLFYFIFSYVGLWLQALVSGGVTGVCQHGRLLLGVRLLELPTLPETLSCPPVISSGAL